MSNQGLLVSAEFSADTNIIAAETEKLLELVYPAYLINQTEVDSLLDKESTLQLDSMTYFRLASCSADTVDTAFEVLNTRVEKLFTALHSINVSICYGLVSRDGITNLVLGIYSKSDVEAVRGITQGMLSGINMESYEPQFSNLQDSQKHHGILSGVPSLYVKEQKQSFSLSSIMRSLNGQDYTVLFIAKPESTQNVMQKISKLISIRDQAFAVSKRNIARTWTDSSTKLESVGKSEGKASTASQVAAGIGVAVGGVVGVIGGPVGVGVGAAIGGGLGGAIGAVIGGGKSDSKSYTASISKTITEGGTISGDIQNGFALELINYAENAIERFKKGQNNGVWQTAIVFSAASEVSKNIIKACLNGELSKPDIDNLPLRFFEPTNFNKNVLYIPELLGQQNSNSLCAYVNSAELGLLCTPPIESVPDFELRIEKGYPLIRSNIDSNSVVLGHVAEGRKSLNNMPFALSHLDLNKHVFVCGITGSGKTTTVKKILKEANKPFLVIESAKKEYRNLGVKSTVYTLGKPELNCPQLNPFYIMPGVSPQTHIDYLKDLFNASFSFHGPMPYILEKCLHSIYEKKGWDLTLGYHPMLANTRSSTDFFDISYLRKRYSVISHKYLFPTMEDLKEEINRYIEEELKYQGEVASNIKTAIKVRLENLCVGAKGFSFNTHEYLDFSEILEKNIIFELEGLADDSDKAFSVGLLVIFINEYRQIEKEMSGSRKNELKHLLVIEEAHRLLKNVETERSAEGVGNSKGKAVEHFTNMIAEMRSYGQGVIVAEQIPTKLAPDVLKNTSTKIVQRVVSADDQQVMANTIGMPTTDALQLGTLESGYAFCHKEGMALPTFVKISNKPIDESGSEIVLDFFVSDEGLFNSNKAKFDRVNANTIRSVLSSDEVVKRKVFALINTLLVESEDIGAKACDSTVESILSCLRQKGTKFIFCKDDHLIAVEYVVDVFLSLITKGVYSVSQLPSDNFISLLKEVLRLPSNDGIKELKKEMSKLYKQDSGSLAQNNIVRLVGLSLKESSDIEATIRSYFVEVSPKKLGEIYLAIKKRHI